MKKTARIKNGQVLSYADYGSENGFPILVQHGLVASIEDIDLFESLLAIGARLICIARPGYGDSSPYAMQNIAEWGDLVSFVIKDLSLSSVDVFGISSGAPYAYSIGYSFPQQARNIFILSGIPALYDDAILSLWPYGVNKLAGIPELEKMAQDLFFANLSPSDLARNDIRDSMQNGGFGLAQDFKLRCVDWGFPLSDVGQQVYMRHSKSDSSVPFKAAKETSALLSRCIFEEREQDEHFSQAVLDDFIATVMARWYAHSARD